MKSLRPFLRSALLVGYVWAIYALHTSLKGAQGFCSARLSYLFLDHFMFVSLSVLPLVIFVLIVCFICRPAIKKVRDEHIIALSMAISSLPVVFIAFAPMDQFAKMSDYHPAIFGTILSVCGLGIIAYLLDRPPLRRLFNSLLIPAIAAIVFLMPFVMKAERELYWVKKLGLSPARLGLLGLYLLPFVALFLIFLVWFKLKPKAAATLGWIFLAVSSIFAIIQPALYTGPNISCKKSAGTDKPNFLFIVIDALRADALEPYGGIVPTPNISEFAGKSVLFENAYTVSSWTMPAMASIFTGLYPSANGVSSSMLVLNKKFDTVYRILKKNGYNTWAVFDQQFYTSYRGINEGFDGFYPISCNPCQIILNHPIVKKAFPRRWTFTFPLCCDHTVRVARDTAAALERSCEPFFGWVHFLDPHMALDPPVEFLDHIAKPDKTYKWGLRGRIKVLEVPSRSEIAKGEIFFDSELANRLRDLYLAEVKYVDHEIALIFDALKRQNLLGKTVVIITADHGEELLDHGGFEHGHSVYNEVLHVPLIIYAPHASALRIQTRARTIDIVPTVLELAGVKFDANGFQGKSLVSLISGESEQDREVLAESMFYYEEKKALLVGPYKLIWRPLAGQYLLFNMVDDPKELYPINGSVEIKKQMLKRLKEMRTGNADIYKKITGRAPERAYETPSADTIEQLKALGYID